MADIKYVSAEVFTTTIELYSGRVVAIDLMAITEREWRKLFKTSTTDEDENKIICKVTDLKPEEVEELKKPEFKQLMEALLKLGLTPAANPT